METAQVASGAEELVPFSESRSFRFALGESIHTENSYKYGVARFRALAQRAGWAHRQLWMDGQSRFALHVLERQPRGVIET